ncbi:amidohydrolase family protein [Christensenellaceae bacterium OttesenSCG-928-K19]|nr:amidohydrolase family protein [Christensenellaceae bacterium OttesenSCG-928-K19]
MEITDMHVHIYPDHLAQRVITNRSVLCYEFASDATLTGTLSKMKEWGIAHAIAASVATRPQTQDAVNAFALRAQCKRIRFMGSVHPYADRIRETLLQIKDSPLAGVKFHAHEQQYLLDEPLAMKAYEECARLELPILLHAGPDSSYPGADNASYERVAHVAGRFAGSKIIFAHFGINGHYDLLDERLLGKDVYLDTSMCHRLADDQVTDIIHAHGAHRVLFGSDCPFANAQAAAQRIQALPLDQEQKEDILHKNAHRLFGVGG